MGCARVLVCLLFPPLAVLDQGCGSVVLVTFLTVFGWAPGALAALIICNRYAVLDPEFDQDIISLGHVLLCLFCPPLAVLQRGCGSMILVFILTLAGWLPGVIAALVISAAPADDWPGRQ